MARRCLFTHPLPTEKKSAAEAFLEFFPVMLCCGHSSATVPDAAGEIKHLYIMSAEDEEFGQWRVRRENAPPIYFWGKELVEAKDENLNMCHMVTIFQTRGGKYVVQQNGRGDYYYSRATSVQTAAEVIDWLRESNGKFSDVATWALNKAAAKNPDFKAAWGEYVD